MVSDLKSKKLTLHPSTPTPWSGLTHPIFGWLIMTQQNKMGYDFFFFCIKKNIDFIEVPLKFETNKNKKKLCN